MRFEAAIGRLIALGCRTFVEIAPHAILQRYLKECLAANPKIYVQMVKELSPFRAQLEQDMRNRSAGA